MVPHSAGMHIAPSIARTDLSDLPALLTVGEAAAYLRRSTRSLRAWEARGLIRVTRPAGGSPLIARTEIQRLLTEGAR